MPGWVFYDGAYVFHDLERVSYQLASVEPVDARTLTVDTPSRTFTVVAEDRTVNA